MTALRGLIELPRDALEGDLSGSLQAIVGDLAAVLDSMAVAINLVRPAWDDYEVVALHGPPDIVAQLSGVTFPRDRIDDHFAARFDVGRAFFIPGGSFPDIGLQEGTAILVRERSTEQVGAWQAEDQFLIPLRDDHEKMVGFVSIDEPISGLRPDAEQISLAVALVDALSVGVRSALRALEARLNADALEALFKLSNHFGKEESTDQLLTTCCEGIRQALGFDRVVLELGESPSLHVAHRASAGWDDNPPTHGVPTLQNAKRLCLREFEIEGCYLLPAEDALAIVGSDSRRFTSVRNGSGPLAWDHHWLLVPLTDTTGTLLGWVWADDPIDHLIPSRAKLRILRTFSNQALVAVTGATHLDRLRTIASRDDLTGALNRRSFFEQLDHELRIAKESGELITLVLYDLDRFKLLNDTHGHPAGDDALRGFTSILTHNLRAGDAVGRLGGDEFAIFLVGSDRPSTQRVIERVAAMLADDLPARSLLGASYGIAESPGDGATSVELVAVADARLYQQKRLYQGADGGKEI